MAERPWAAKVGVIAVLAIVLAVVLLRQFGALSLRSNKGGNSAVPAPSGKTGEPTTPNAQSAQPASPTAQWKRPEPVGPIARNPMYLDLSKQAPPESKADAAARPAGSQFTVTGIVYSTEQPSSVIVEGRILHEGDTIHGAAVARITENAVEFSLGDKKWTVRAGEQTTNPE